MGKQGIRVLQECNQDEPVVHPVNALDLLQQNRRRLVPEVRNDVDAEHGGEAPSGYRDRQSSQPQEDSDVRDDDLAPLVRREHDGLGRKVFHHHKC